MILYKIIQKINHIRIKIKQQIVIYKLRSKIKHLGKNVYVNKYFAIYGSNLTIEDNVSIGDGSWLAAKPIDESQTAILEIGKGSCIGRFNEIYATKEIILEDKVLTAERVYISDNIHGYKNPNMPIMDQPLVQKGTVRIGEGSWLGAGVCVIGANIGKHCVIGANAVVTHDIPDYSVAVGCPAKVIKRFDSTSNKWVII